jgi:hypothetical protein
MKYKTRSEIDTMTDTELLQYVNEYLKNGSLNKFEEYHNGSPKGYIKSRLKKYGYCYNSDIKKFILDTTTDTITEVLPTVATEDHPVSNENQVFHDIRNILEIMSLHMTSLCDDVAIIKDHVELSPVAGITTTEAATNIDDLKPLKLDEDYVNRNLKVYPSIMKRMKKLTKDTQMQQQQVVSLLLDRALKDLGY